MSTMMWAIILCGLLSIVYGAFTVRAVMAADAGTPRMQEIAAAIQEGAQAYLTRQYTTIGIVGVGRGARAGVLIKNAEALERFEKIDTLVIDKTGTLTLGKPSVVATAPAAGFAEEEVLRLAASLEKASEHPLGDAIVRAARQRGLGLADPEAVDSPIGRGLIGHVEGRKVMVGGAPLMREHGIDPAALAERAEGFRSEGATAVFVAVDGALAGLIAIADPIKPTSAEAVRALHAEHVRLVMMTGDNRTTALAVAKRLGIDWVEAEVTPQDKARLVKRLRQEGRVVAMAATTRPRSPPPMSAWPWARARMSPSKARA